MTRFRAVNLFLLVVAMTITTGLVGFLVTRLGGHDEWVPVFGRVVVVGVVAFAGLLSVGLAIGAHHTVHWVVRSILGKPPPDWSYETEDPS